MNTTQKQKVTDALKQGVEAGKVAANATQDKAWPAWLRWVVIIGASAAAAVGALVQVSCERVQSITPEQVQQAGEVVHGIYHVIHVDRECILVEECDK